MAGATILIVFFVYFGILCLVSYLTSRKKADNETFFTANRQSRWYIVAIGMIGASVSGVTFVSVPGMVNGYDMTYMQMVLGFIPGYIIIALVLLPLYYKLNLISIYTYLEVRFGFWSYKTGAAFFILSRIIGSAAKLYLVTLILQKLVFDYWNMPFEVTVTILVFMIWVYTHKSGINTIIWTDTLQTICFVIAAILIVSQISSSLNFDMKTTITAIADNPHSRVFVFDDWKSSQHFFKQFFSGIFIVIVMSGLDQDIMQKNLTCRTLNDARKNMITSGFLFVPINLLFLSLGVLILIFASTFNIVLPEKSDEVLPYLVNNYLGSFSIIFFTIGLIGASFANADSALTSLTTSFCIDILNINKIKSSDKANRLRKLVHFCMSLAFIVVISAINYYGTNNTLNTIYKIASYTYGPLLGLFMLGLFSKIKLLDKYVPVVCLAALLCCYCFEKALFAFAHYKAGYEILILNGLLTVIGLLFIKVKNKTVK